MTRAAGRKHVLAAGLAIAVAALLVAGLSFAAASGLAFSSLAIGVDTRLFQTTPSNPTLPPADLSLSVVNPRTGDSVSSSPALIVRCTKVCAADFDHGTSVTLTATEASSGTFSGWAGCDSSSRLQCSVTMSEPRSVTAYFNR